MKKEKLKKYSIRFGVAFFIVLAFLTYFSSTIDNMLLPQVKVTQISYGTIDGNQSSDDRYLIPISAVIAMGDTGSVFVTRTDENNKTTVSEATVNIENSDVLHFQTRLNIYHKKNINYHLLILLPVYISHIWECHQVQ